MNGDGHTSSMRMSANGMRSEACYVRGRYSLANIFLIFSQLHEPIEKPFNDIKSAAPHTHNWFQRYYMHYIAVGTGNKNEIPAFEWRFQLHFFRLFSYTHTPAIQNRWSRLHSRVYERVVFASDFTLAKMECVLTGHGVHSAISIFCLFLLLLISQHHVSMQQRTQRVWMWNGFGGRQLQRFNALGISEFGSNQIRETAGRYPII